MSRRVRHLAESLVVFIVLTSIPFHALEVAAARPARAMAPARAFTVPRGTHLVVISPHPDDETLAAGGTIQSVLHKGGRVDIIFLTHGDGFPLSAERTLKRVRPASRDYLKLGSLRQKESLSALEYIRITYLRRMVDLFARKYELVNERNTIFLNTDYGQVAMVEIADKFINKITCYVRPNDRVAAGQKVSFIARGSQVDLILFRKDVEFLVETGQQVYGALTPIARFPGGSR